MIPLGLPGLWVMVGGILAYGWLTGFRSVGIATIVIVLGIAFLGEIIDNWLGVRFAKRYGGSHPSGLGRRVRGSVGGEVGVASTCSGDGDWAFICSLFRAPRVRVR